MIAAAILCYADGMFFGLGGFTQDTNFACLQSCYGKGYVPGVTPQRRVGNVFLELQQVANRAALKYSLSTVDEDELIGPSTATLINQIAQQSSVGALAHAPFDKEKAAREAPELITAINAVLAGKTTPTVTPTTMTVPPGTTPTTPDPKVTTTRTTTRTTEITPSIVIEPKTKIILGVVIGAVVLGGGIAAVAIARGSKPEPYTRGGPTRKARRR